MNRRKLIGILVSVLVAGLGTMILLKSVNSKEKSAAPIASEPMVSVLKVVRPIAKGTPADQLGDAIAVQQVRQSEKLPDTAESPAQIAGLVANTDLVPNEQIVVARFVPASEQKKEEAGAGDGLIGVWVALDPVRALAAQSGKLAVGDRVAVFANIRDTTGIQPNPLEPSETSPGTHIILHKVPILDCIGCIDLAPVAPTANGAAAPAAPAPAAGGTVQVKLGVDAPAAERLVFSIKYGDVWLADEPSDVIEDNTKIVDRSNIYVPTEPQVPTAPSLEGTAGAAKPATTPTPAAGATATASTTPTAGATATTKPAAAGASAGTAAPSLAPAPGAATPKPAASPAANPITGVIPASGSATETPVAVPVNAGAPS